jgi:NAD(P)-dependent dehydrogenase (short-subunit alcohol dehydrogenase family)
VTGALPELDVPSSVPQDFAGKVALVTGGSRGIGLGIAAEIVARGGRVAITARKPDELDAAVLELGGPERGWRGSADDEAHQAEAVAGTIERFGSLDCLVNNAGINPHFGETLGAEASAFHKTLNVNVVAPWAWTKIAWSAYLAEHGGSVLNVASVGGLKTGSPLGIYGVSKAALIHLTKQLAAELGPKVRVNAMAPAVVKTKFARLLYEADEAGAAARYPMKRLGVTEDTSKLAAFLLGPDSTWITGECVTIDGGGLAAY